MRVPINREDGCTSAPTVVAAPSRGDGYVTIAQAAGEPQRWVREL